MLGVSEPKPLNPTEQDALVKQIGLTLMRAAPEGWRQVTAEYRATGRYFELAAEVLSVDGSVHGWAPPQDVAMLFARLRAGMHREGRGSWSNARYQLDHPSSYNLDFDRAEPQWQTPPPPQAYFDEMRFFPRTEDNVPDWLRRRLGPPAPPPQGAQIPQVPQGPQTPSHPVPPLPAAPPPAGPPLAGPPLAGPPPAGPPPAGRSFRTARVFDGAGPGGRPSVNRPPVPEVERQLLLDYLDHAPVAVANRGFDADVLHPDLPSVVPVAFQTDGHWIWPAAVGYYLRSYGVPPEAELVERARAAGFRSPEVSEESRVAAAANLGAPPAPQGTPLPQPPVVETPEPAEPEIPEEPEEPEVADHAPDELEDEMAGPEPVEQEHVHQPEDAEDEPIQLELIDPEPIEREVIDPEPVEREVIQREVIQRGEAEPETEIEETVNLVDFQPALAEHEEAHHQADLEPEPVEAEPEQLVEFDQSKFDAAQDGPPYRVSFDDDDAPTRVNPAVDDRYRRESYVDGMDLFAPQPQQDTQEWSPFEDDHTEIDLEPVVDEVEEDLPEEVVEPVAETPSEPAAEPAESGRRHLIEREPEPELVEDELVDVPGPFQMDAESRQSDDTTEFEVDQEDFDSDRAAEPEPERPRQPSPEEERELGNVRRALDDLDVPPAAYRFGEPADRTWGMRTAGDGWEVAWFDHGPNNPVRFERVDDAAAYLIGKLVLTGRRTPRRPQIPPLQAPSLPPRPPRQPDQVNGFRDEGRRPLLPPRPPEQVRPEPVRPEPARPEPAAQESTDAGKPARGWPIKPLNGEPPLTLFRQKKMIELAPGTEVDRFGDPNGNLAYTAGTPFEERSLVPSWINRPYRAYRLRRPVEVLTGVAVPWFEQPGGGTAYLFPKAIEEMLADGSLVEITQDAHAPR
jgi:hypothetical protein